MENSSSKKEITDSERLEIARKLDEDLENFINGLEKRKYTEEWPIDRWEEEMEKHPFFMKNAPQPGDKLSPLMEGLQQLKYDANENTPEELVNAYKEDGNFNFKHKNYRLAIIAYTEGIKVKCNDIEMQATLYNNRSAAHYFLQNYRSSLKDAKLALELKPGYQKASIRAAQCYYALELYENAIQICDDLLSENRANENVLIFRSKLLMAKRVQQRNDRKKQICLSKKMQVEQVLMDTIFKSGIQIDGSSGDSLKLECLEPHVPQLANSQVHLDENGKLIWPVIVTYPEYSVLDFIQEFHEDDIFQVHLNEVLTEFPEWDSEKKYSSTNINMYIELKNRKLRKVNVNQSLREVLRLQGCIVKGGTPSFIIVVKDSLFEKHFLKQY